VFIVILVILFLVVRWIYERREPLRPGTVSKRRQARAVAIAVGAGIASVAVSLIFGPNAQLVIAVVAVLVVVAVTRFQDS
jgi:hypothetical protein